MPSNLKRPTRASTSRKKKNTKKQKREQVLTSEQKYLKHRSWSYLHKRGTWWYGSDNDEYPPRFVRLSDLAPIEKHCVQVPLGIESLKKVFEKEAWNSKKYGAMLCGHEKEWNKHMDCCRYAGSIDLQLLPTSHASANFDFRKYEKTLPPGILEERDKNCE